MASRKNKPIDKKYCEMVIEAAKQMAGRALTVATWGNISIRDPETGPYLCDAQRNGLRQKHPGGRGRI